MATRRKPAATPEPSWRLTWGAHTWTEDDIVGNDMAAASMLVGNDWAQMDPTVGPVNRMAFIAVLSARTTGRPLGDVWAEICQAHIEDIAKALTVDD